jgi:hypothetical protein
MPRGQRRHEAGSAGVRAFAAPRQASPLIHHVWLALHYTSPVLAYACLRQVQGVKHQHRLILGVARPIPSEQLRNSVYIPQLKQLIRLPVKYIFLLVNGPVDT